MTALSRWSKRALAHLSKHPTLKLAAFLWVGACSVASPVYMFYKDREEARRNGLLDIPAIKLSFDGRRCVLINEGPRPVVEATLIFESYVMDATACLMPLVMSSSRVHADAAARELLPRDQLVAQYDDQMADACHAVGEPGSCGPEQDCRTVAECQALYYRPSDMEPFEKRALALSTKGCGSLRAFDSLYAFSLNGNATKITWPDPADERALRCFMRSRAGARWLFEDAEAASKRLGDAAADTLRR
jgi:hypothetical protein